MNMGRENPDTNERFSMSVFALILAKKLMVLAGCMAKCQRRCSKVCGKAIAGEESHVSYVTNGVHMQTWAASEWKESTKKLSVQIISMLKQIEKTWAPILKAKDEDIWNLRLKLKNKLIDFVKKDFASSWLKNQGDPSRILSIIEKINS